MSSSAKTTSLVDEFYIAAREYCRLTENIQKKSKIEFLTNIQKILTLVYLKATLLDKLEENADGESEKFVQEEDWIFIQNLVSDKIGSADSYIEIEFPDRIAPDNIENELLSDCLADIYQDLKDFTSNYEFGNIEALIASLFECVQNFEKIWGPKLLAILVNIHSLIYSDHSDDEENVHQKYRDNKHEKSDSSNWLINERFNE